MLVSLKGNSIRAARGTSVLPILSPGSSSSNQDWVAEAEAWSSLSKDSSDSCFRCLLLWASCFLSLQRKKFCGLHFPLFLLRLFISQLTTITILLPNTQHPPASHWNLEPKGHLFKSLSQYNNESSLRLLDKMHPHWLIGFDWTLFYGVMSIFDYSPTGLLTLLFLLVISHCCSISPGHSLLYPI